MSNIQLRTPVAFLIFNRPDTTEKVFAEIAKAKPQKLLVVADGPRSDHPEDAKKCAASRAIIERVDWDCEVLTNYSDVNLGCKRRVSSGLDWVFENVEEAIILEDDCLPSNSFFWYCQELLKHYRNDKRVMHLCGSNFQFGRQYGEGSYYFSKYAEMWGWATWRRAWKFYDVNMKTFPEFLIQNQINSIFESENLQRYWLGTMERTYNCTINTWDYQWIYAIWIQNGLCIIPNVNLISNIGFGNDSTHSWNENDKVIKMTNKEILNIEHPIFFIIDREADLYHTEMRFIQSKIQNQGIIIKIKNIINSVAHKTKKFLIKHLK